MAGKSYPGEGQICNFKKRREREREAPLNQMWRVMIESEETERIEIIKYHLCLSREFCGLRVSNLGFEEVQATSPPPFFYILMGNHKEHFKL